MKALRKPLSLFMAMLMCLGIFAGTGTTAFAAGETMTTYMVEFPRASDPNKAGWGHPALNFLGGWSTGENDSFSVHTQDAFNGRAIYCIEPGVGVNTGDQYTGRGEDFWDNYPSNLNPTIPPDTIKEYIGRIMTYGWQGNASTSWMTDDPEDASKMAGAIATQLLVWETVVGERDSQFNHVDANAQGKNNIAEYISPENPLYSEIFSQYSAIESAVKRHTMLPSFFSSTADAGAYELKWDGQQYSLTLTDTNGVLSDYTFSSSTTGLNFSVDGNQLTITSARAIKGSVTVKAEKISAQRSGVVVWTDGVTGGGKQDFATYGETVSDYMVGYLNLEVKTGNMKLVKTSEDGQVAGISFTITGEGYSATKTTNEAGEIDITDLNPGVYTITEQSIDKYEPQETQRVTIVSGQTSTVNFNNKLKRGSLEVTKTSEDGLVEGMTFHLYGTSLSGQPVDEYAVTDGNGVARFENVLIGTGYVLEEVDTPIRYVVPDSQTATIEWNEVTHKSVNNMLKKFRVTVTKSDVETGAPQGDGSLAGAVYGLYKGDTLIDSFTTDENGRAFLSLEDGSYYALEVEANPNFVLDDTPHYFEVKDGKVTTLRLTNAAKSGILIHKVDTSGEGIYGVKFLLYDKNRNPIGEFTSDNEGYVYITADDLPDGANTSGRFYLRELEAAEGYILDEEYKTVYVRPGHTAEIEWVNEAITGQIQIYKYAAEYNEVTGTPAGTPLQGAVYEISNARTGEVVDYITTDARGVAASKPLPLTRYKIVEVTAPAYWQIDPTVHDVTLEYAGQIIKISAYDKPSNLGVTITKRGNAEVLAGQTMRYDLTVANTSNVPLENFYWHDKIPYDVARATTLTTGTYSARLNYRILYKTNYQTSYQVLASNLLTSNNYSFALNAIPLQAGEVVTDVYFDFGKVPVGFQSVTGPTLSVIINGNTVNGYQLVNRADVGGKYQGTWQTAQASWVTIIRKYTTTPDLPKTGY